MNVPARGVGGELAYNFGPPEAAVTSDERNFMRRRRGSHEAAENGKGQRLRCLKWGGGACRDRLVLVTLSKVIPHERSRDAGGALAYNFAGRRAAS
ncbi:MAG: hypothetical protein IKR48_00260 [Kiritimatiellae bacterium]|nr:hypothetical protein [Kiritimatiellia bacterium]